MGDKGPKGTSCYENIVISALIYCGLRDKQSLDFKDIYRLMTTIRTLCFKRGYLLSASLNHIIMILREDLHYNVDIDRSNIF